MKHLFSGVVAAVKDAFEKIVGNEFDGILAMYDRMKTEATEFVDGLTKSAKDTFQHVIDIVEEQKRR